MRRGTLSSRLVVCVLAALGLLWGPLAVSALADTSVQGQNNADGSGAASGDATGGNGVGQASAGPQAIDGSSGAVVHDGEDSAEVEQTGTAQAGSSVAGGQTTAIKAGGKVTVDMKNNAEDSEATVGDATVTNAIGGIEVGPRVSAGACGGGVGDFSISNANGCIIQDGDITLDVSQSAAALTGDAVAGSQVLGAFGSDVAALLDNTSEDAEATGGDAEAINELPYLVVGPVITDAITRIQLSASIDGPVDADIVHEGDNENTIEQDAEAGTGDAVAGGQVVGAGGGDVAIDATNDSEDAESVSGDATASNDLDGAEAGPRPHVLGDLPFDTNGVTLPFLASIDAGSIEAQIVHDGDNELEVAQNAEAAGGDAVAGAQVFGVVNAHDVALVASNASEDADATSGDGDASNTVGTLFSGPEADVCAVESSDSSCTFLTRGASIDAAGTIGAQIVHEGDNDLSLDQDAGSSTGDAVAGGGVYGVTASGDVEIDASNESEDAEATSGNSSATNDLTDAYAGPEADICLASASGTGTADCTLATGVDAGSIDLGLFTLAQIVHDGDNDLEIGQSAGSDSGDAVAGGQVAGMVGRTIDASFANESEDADATSGDSDAANTVDTAFAGPEADACVVIAGEEEDAECTVRTLADEVEADSIELGTPALAQIIHDGDNDLVLGQTADGSGGDAVAGGQVMGAIGDNRLVASNESEDAEATSGDVTASNDVGDAWAGPEADICLQFSDEEGDCELRTLSDDFAESVSAGNFTFAQIFHDGDNELDLDQAADAHSGDAVAGGQVAGIIAAGNVDELALSNEAEDSDATTGSADATNNVDSAHAGPQADFCLHLGPDEDSTCDLATGSDAGAASVELGDESAAQIAHDGDNELDLGQSADSGTGDAVSGGQVAGVISTGDVHAHMSNESEDSEATTGEATSTNVVGSATAGPLGNVCIADDVTVGECVTGFADSVEIGDDSIIGIAHDGDNELDLGQNADAASGDAVSGQQFGGFVADGDVFVRAANDAEDSDSTTGDATASNVIDTAVAGPEQSSCVEVTMASCFISSASVEVPADSIVPIAHDGDNDLSIDQSADGAAGDAASGGQVMGIHAGGDAEADLSNESEDAEATSGDGTGQNSIDFASAGPSFFAVGFELPGQASISGDVEGSILHDGDNDLSIGQSASGTSGDAMAGSQVSGLVAGGDAVLAVSNDSEDSDATSGDGTSSNAIRLAASGPVVGGIPTFVLLSIEDATALILHDGDDELDINQTTDSGAGDALSGAQVNGVISKGDADVTADNASEDADSEGGEARSDSDILRSRTGAEVLPLLEPLP